MRCEFIARHSREYTVTELCGVLKVSPSGYYAWRKRVPNRRQQANVELVKRIRQVHQDSRQTYGSPRVHAELCEAGVKCGRNRVARLMRQHGFRAKHATRTTVTTDSRHAYPIAPNILNRAFEAAAPNRTWLADITYIDTSEGWLYLAVVLDVFSRMIVGWAMADHLETSLVIEALDRALFQRRPRNGLLHHSDRGSQYASADYQQRLKDGRIQVSMSRTGNCYDNAMMESFFGTLKTECVEGRYESRAIARCHIFEYIAAWYNPRRRHSALGYLSPECFEQRHASRLSSLH